MFLSNIKSLKRTIYKTIIPEKEFTKRIRYRYTVFWGDNFMDNVASLPLMQAEDSIAKWRESENWQRLLENKHNAREFAKKMGCRVPELYWKGKEVAELAFAKLPPQYVLRPTIGHSARQVYLIDNNINLFDKNTYTINRIVEGIVQASAHNPGVEYLCEEFMTDENGVHRIPDDYKFYMFNGEVACIQVINRFGPRQEGVKGTVQYYDERWNIITKIKKSAYAEGEYQQAPKCLDEMINFAKTLSKAYQTFVRVDLYATQKGAVFGEFCPTPARGYGYTAHGSKFLVSYWDKYCNGLI